MTRFFLRLLWRLAWWQKLALAGLAPLLSLNLAVAFFGNSLVSPVSPYFLKEKWHALGEYAAHRPGCLLRGDGDVEALAAQAEVRHGLPAGLMRAVVRVESGSEPHRISYAGAMGPAQLMPGTAAMLGVSDPFDPAEAVDAGARYLAQLLRRKGDVRLAVASYNAGPGAVSGQVPQNGETEVYVAKVMRAFTSARP
ncbi:MAG: lytic transglycosylase domain-containing protein [Myxococcaceae bacterium]